MKSKSATLLNYQYEAINEQCGEVLVSGGIGSGKTQLGSHWIISKIAEFPKSTLLIAANTYSQLMNASVKTLTNTLDDLSIPYKAILSGARKRIEIGKAVESHLTVTT